MICFWNQQVLERFEQVDRKFLVRGHTYLPNDRVKVCYYSNPESEFPIVKVKYTQSHEHLESCLAMEHMRITISPYIHLAFT